MKRLACLAVAALSAAPTVFCASSVHANTIYSDNFSGTPSGGFNNTSQTSFTATQTDFTEDSNPSPNAFGVYSYSGVGVTNPPPSGSPNGLYDNSSGSTAPFDSLYHDAGSLVANTQYTLQAYAVLRSGSAPGGLTIELYSGPDDTLADDTLLNSYYIDESTMTVGTSQAISTSFTTGASVTGDIIVRLKFTVPSTSYQTWVGDVSLDATAVPEPAAGGLLLLALPLALRRKRIAV
jgi:hypothetical protein